MSTDSKTGLPSTSVNTRMAAEFLDIISDHDANWHFQTFLDKKDATAQATTPEGAFNGMMADVLATTNKHGGGIFVAINEHEKNKRRTKKTTSRINAIFCDFDDAETALDQLKALSFAIAPTVVVESSPNKYHAYFVLAQPGSIPVADFSRWQRSLSKQYGSDPKIIDPSRVMRMPGYIHQKGEPFQTHILPEMSSYHKYTLDELVAAVYGGRNNWLTSVAGELRNNGVDKEELQSRLNDYNNSLNAPLDEEELVVISQSMQNYDPDPVRAKDYQVEVISRTLNLDVNKNGGVLATQQNMLKVVMAENRVKFNKMTGQVEIIEGQSWNRPNKYPAWSDLDTTNFLYELIDKYNCEWYRGHLESAIDKAATMNSYDPLIDYLKSLEWDQTPRIATVFQRHLDVPDNEYVQAVATSMFVGAVRRAIYPGCKYDHMVVLIGEEGSGKSKFCSTIAKYHDFFTDTLGDLRNKDAIVNMQGKWIIEFGELKALQGVSAEHTKAFLSAEVDNIRLPFGRRTTPMPRRCIFIGTTNNYVFITDTGTNRRTLPIFTPLSEESGKVMDVKKLEAEVDQLWAEAVQLVRDGATGIMPHSVMEHAMEQRLISTEDGDYAADIIRYINDDDGEIVNGIRAPRRHFVPRDFYLSVVENASREKWVGENRLHKQIVNSARKVFKMPEYSHYSYGRYRVDGVITKCWQIKDEK